MFPARTVGSYLNMASRSVLGENTPFHSLAVWHGFNLPLMMSLAAMVGGILLYRALGEYQQGTTVVPLIERFDAAPDVLEEIATKAASEAARLVAEKTKSGAGEDRLNAMHRDLAAMSDKARASDGRLAESLQAVHESLKQLVYGQREDASLVASMLNRVRLLCTTYDPAAVRYRFSYAILFEIIIGAASLAGVLVFAVRLWRQANTAGAR